MGGGGDGERRNGGREGGMERNGERGREREREREREISLTFLEGHLVIISSSVVVDSDVAWSTRRWRGWGLLLHRWRNLRSSCNEKERKYSQASSFFVMYRCNKMRRYLKTTVSVGMSLWIGSKRRILFKTFALESCTFQHKIILHVHARCPLNQITKIFKKKVTYN